MPGTTRKPAATEATPTALVGGALQIAMDTAPAIRFEPGQTEVVTLVGAKIATGGDYGSYPMLLLQLRDTGQVVAWHAYHEVARRKLSELRPARGDVFTIHYVGEKETNETIKLGAAQGAEFSEKDARSYHPYSIFMGDGTDDVAVEDIDWSAIAD